METSEGRRELKSVQKALKVLECVISHPNGISLANISRDTGINRNTAFQILNTLCACDYLFQDKSSKDYFSGPKLIWICTANNAHSHLLRIAKPILAKLTQETQETSHLAVLDGRYVRFLEKEEAQQSLVVVTNLEEQVEVQIASVGKAILSQMPESRVEALIRRIPYRAHTSKSICSIEQMRADLALTRERGYAIDDEESFIGIRCVAAPVFDAQNNVLCAIGISAPAVRIPSFEAAAKHVLCAAEEMHKKLCGEN